MAFELVQLLNAAGIEVLSLTLADSEVPKDDWHSKDLHDEPILSEWIEIFQQMLADHIGLSGRQLISYPQEIRLRKVHRALVEHGLLSGSTSPEILRGPLRTFSVCARMNYIPTGVYRGPAQLVMAADSVYEDHGDRDQMVMGWRLFAPNLRDYVIAGNHMTMLKPPFAAALVEILRNIQTYQ